MVGKAKNKILGVILERTLRERMAEFGLAESALIGVRDENADALERVWKLLNESPSLREAVIVEVSKATTAFVAEEFERLSAIKRSREFTADEIAYGRTVLPALLDSLEKLVDPDSSR